MSEWGNCKAKQEKQIFPQLPEASFENVDWERVWPQASLWFSNVLAEIPGYLDIRTTLHVYLLVPDCVKVMELLVFILLSYYFIIKHI